MTHDEKNAMIKGIAAGTLIGGLIGAAIALLHAPKSGRELRTDIRLKTNRLLSDAEAAIEKAKAKVASTVQEAKDRMVAEETRLKEAVKAGVEAYKEERKNEPGA